MNIKSFDQLTSMEIDTLREIGSIGTGNAATAMSTMLGRQVRITLPEVRIIVSFFPHSLLSFSLPFFLRQSFSV